VRIALVSEHASPLAVIGGVDAGGRNVHVAELASGLVRLGHSVSVYTRLDDPDLGERVTTSAGYEVVHVPAGPAAPVSKDDLWPHMAAFGDHLTQMLKFQLPRHCACTFLDVGLGSGSRRQAAQPSLSGHLPCARIGKASLPGSSRHQPAQPGPSGGGRG
jgi:hypothetical protein